MHCNPAARGWGDGRLRPTCQSQAYSTCRGKRLRPTPTPFPLCLSAVYLLTAMVLLEPALGGLWNTRCAVSTKARDVSCWNHPPSYHAVLLQQRQLSLRGGASDSYDSDSFNDMMSIPSSDDAVEAGTNCADKSVAALGVNLFSSH